MKRWAWNERRNQFPRGMWRSKRLPSLLPRLGLAVCGALVTWGGHAVAAQADPKSTETRPGEAAASQPAVAPQAAPATVKRGMFQLGVQIAKLPEVVRRQMRLEQGVWVERVLPDSPAAKAGLQPHDILLSAGETPIREPEDILRVLGTSDGQPLKLRILREGREETVEVTPQAVEGRSEAWRGFFPPGVPLPPGVFGGPTPPDWKQWPEYKQFEEALEQLRSRIGRDGLGVWFARPGLVVPPGKFDFFWGSAEQAPRKLERRLRAEFLDGWTVDIEREEPQAAKIRVQRGDQSWEVTEERLHELPKEVQPRVQRLLGMGLGMRLPLAVRVLEKKTEKASQPERKEKTTPPDKSGTGGETGELHKLLQRLEEANQASRERMEEAIRQLRKELEELRKGLAAPATAQP